MTTKQIYLITLLLCAVYAASAQNDFYDIDDVQSVSITFEQDNWPYMLDSLRYNGDEMLQAKIRINNQDFEMAGVRYRDARSFMPGRARNSLFINLGAFTGDAAAVKYQGHQLIQLSSSLRDPSLLREVLAAETIGNYIPTPKANFAKVYINDKRYGLMVNAEVVEGDFLQRHYGTTNGQLLLANPDIGNSPPQGCNSKVFGSLQYEDSEECLEHNFDHIQGEDWADLHTLTQIIKESPDKAHEHLNVDATLWMLAFNNLMVNLNSYSGQYAMNYHLYQDANGVFQPIMGQLNLAFGSFKNPGLGQSDWRTPQLLTMIPTLHLDNEERPLISALLANSDFRKQYLSHYRTMLVEELMSGRFENRARTLTEMISPMFIAEGNQYYTEGEFKSSLTEVVGQRSRIPGLVDFMAKRTNWLESQSVYTVLPPSISRVSVKQRERFSSQFLVDFTIRAKVEGYPKRVYLYYRFSDSQGFSMMEMYDDGSNDDGEASDGVFAAVAKPENGESKMEYYIMGENAKTVGYSPQRYTFERHEVTLAEINK